MRKSLEQFLVADWLEAMTTMRGTQFRKLVRVAQLGGIDVPTFATGNSIPVIRFDFAGGSETARFERVQQIERVEQFKKEINAWARDVEADLKRSIAANARTGRNHYGRRLADTLSHKIHLDRQFKMEPKSIGFNFARHGVYWAKGAHSGFAGLVGSKWTDRFGRLKKTNPSSLGKAAGGVDWFNSVIDRHIGDLADIASDYCGDMTLDLARLHIS